MNYYVYEDDSNRKIRVHAGSCKNCNEGKGKQLPGKLNQWHGPYDTLAAAQAFAKSLRKRNTRTCQNCLPDRKPVSAW